MAQAEAVLVEQWRPYPDTEGDIKVALLGSQGQLFVEAQARYLVQAVVTLLNTLGCIDREATVLN